MQALPVFHIKRIKNLVPHVKLNEISQERELDNIFTKIKRPSFDGQNPIYINPVLLYSYAKPKLGAACFAACVSAFSTDSYSAFNFFN